MGYRVCHTKQRRPLSFWWSIPIVLAVGVLCLLGIAYYPRMHPMVIKNVNSIETNPSLHKIAEIYNEKRAVRARLESSWATLEQKEIAYEPLMDALKKETCFISTVSFLEDYLPAVLKKKKFADTVYASRLTSSETAYSKASEKVKLTAAINILAKSQTQLSDIDIGPIESGFPAVSDEERKMAKTSDITDEQQVTSEKTVGLLSSPTLAASVEEKQTEEKPPIKKAIYKKFEGKKEVPKPSKVSTNGFDVATLSFVATVFASTLDDLPENIGRKLTTLAKSSFSDFPQIPKSNPVSTSKNEREEPPMQDVLAREVSPASPPSNHFGGFARLGKREAVKQKHVEKLMELNDIKDPTKLPIGMTIQVPLDPTDEGSPTQGYKVLKGDCPYKIALKFWGDGNHSSLHKKAKSSKAKMAKAKMRSGNASSTP